MKRLIVPGHKATFTLCNRARRGSRGTNDWSAVCECGWRVYLTGRGSGHGVRAMHRWHKVEVLQGDEPRWSTNPDADTAP